MAPREPGARKRLKEFLLQHVGEVLDSDELRIVLPVIRVNGQGESGSFVTKKA